MDRKQLSAGLPEKLRDAVRRYKYVLAVVLLGAALMLLPAGGGKTARGADLSAPEPEPSGQTELEEALAAFDGVGRLRLVIRTEPETQRFEGALVVCEGGGDAAVRLQLTKALSALTGLSSEKIAIVKGTP